MRKVVRIAAIMAMLHITPALAAEHIATYVSGFKPVGSARMSVLMFDVYDATLFAKNGIWQSGDPLALQLTYLRAIRGFAIADRSVEEMRNIGITDEIKLAAWHTQMKRIFPDVYEGTILTGVLMPNGETLFLENGKEIGRVKDTDFGKAFFGIWLSERTSAPDLRSRLLGYI